MDPYGLREAERAKRGETVKAGANIFFPFIASSARNEHEVVMGLLTATRHAIGAMASHT